MVGILSNRIFRESYLSLWISVNSIIVYGKEPKTKNVEKDLQNWNLLESEALEGIVGLVLGENDFAGVVLSLPSDRLPTSLVVLPDPAVIRLPKRLLINPYESIDDTFCASRYCYELTICINALGIFSS
jgi:hypothetical protein